MQSNYLLAKDVSKMTGVPLKMVQKWCKNGLLKSTRPFGREYLIAKADYEEFLKTDVCILAITRANSQKTT